MKLSQPISKKFQNIQYYIKKSKKTKTLKKLKRVKKSIFKSLLKTYKSYSTCWHNIVFVTFAVQYWYKNKNLLYSFNIQITIYWCPIHIEHKVRNNKSIAWKQERGHC
jgi:hypothetical protein